MHLSKQERIRFLIILGGFLLGSLLLLLTPILVRQKTIRRAWVPEVAGIIRNTVIGKPSSIVAEVQAILGQSKDVPLPPPESGYNIGFLVTRDGFGFRNYGTRYPQSNITINEVRELFGNAVCISISNESCVPTPAAQLWVDAMNDFMADGHCAGFTIAGYRFFTEQLEQVDFTPGAFNTFTLEQNTPAMRQIARDWVLQTAEEIWSKRIGGTPRDIIDALLTRTEPVDLGIFGRQGGGHSMLAYGLEDKGNGIYHILVYDNNWPGQELVVEVNYKANTWRYSLAANNSGQDTKIWDGDAHTNSLIFIPFPLYNQPMTCPFCPPDSTHASSELTFVALSGDDGLLQISNDANRKLGHFKDEYIKDIPGSHLVRLKDAMYNNREPLLFLNKDDDFNITVQPRPGKPYAKANLRIGGSGIAMSIENLLVMAGQQDDIAVSPKNQSLKYTPAGNARPILKIAVQKMGESNMIIVSGVDMKSDQSLDVSVDSETGQLVIGGTELEDDTLSVVVVKANAQGRTVIFAGDKVPLTSNGVVALDVENWDGEGTLDVLVDPEGDGVFEPAEPLEDEPLSEVIDEAQSVAEIIGAVGDMAPYMDEQETESLLDSLADMAQEGVLNGNQLGEVVADMEALDLSNEQLVELVEQAELPVNELAGFLTGLNLPPETVTALTEDIVAGLALSPEQAEALRAEIDALDEANTILAEIEFNNFETPQELSNFLAQQDIPLAQLVKVITELALPPDQAETLALQLDIPAGQPAEDSSGNAETSSSAEPTPASAEPTPSPTEAPSPGDDDDDDGDPEPGNAAPGAVNDNAVTDIGVAVTIDVLNNDADQDEDTITIASAGAAGNGVTNINGNQIIYIPNPGFNGTDTFNYTITDGNLSDTAAVTVRVNAPPNAVGNIAVTPEDIAIHIAVLSNDTDPDGDALSIAAFGQAINGNTGVGGSAVRYAPNTGFIGADVFTYTVTDGRLLDTATVTVTVNGAPLAVDDVATTTEETAVTITVLTNDTDPDNDPLNLVSVNPAVNGSVGLGGNNALYTPNPNFTGVDSFLYTISDGYSSVSARITVTVQNTNDSPHAVSDIAVTNEDTPVIIDALTNDTDPDNDPLIITVIGPAGNGNADAFGEGDIVYTPTLNFNGVDVFTYTVTDGTLFDTTDVTVIVNAVNNDPPLAAGDAVTTTINTPINVNVLDNDTDPDNDTLGIVTAGLAANGATSFFPGGSTVSYSPNSGFIGTDTFTYTITDGGLFDTGVVTVSIVISITSLSVDTGIPNNIFLPIILK